MKVNDDAVQAVMKHRAPCLENLRKFAQRHMLENDNMRARIYDYLRHRYNMPSCFPEQLREYANAHYEDGTTGRDVFGLRLLDYAWHLQKCREDILSAALEVKQC